MNLRFSPFRHALPDPVAFVVAPWRFRLTLFYRLHLPTIVLAVPADGVIQVPAIVCAAVAKRLTVEKIAGNLVANLGTRR